MKITTFNPLIITRDAEPIVRRFEELGFKRHHRKEGIGEFAFTDIRMKDANGFYLDIMQTDALPLKQDWTAVRMNVDDFFGAYSILLSRGFKNASVDRTAETASSRSALMIAPSGFSVYLVQHIRT